MPDDLEDRFQTTLLANDSLLRAVVVRLMLPDPAFTQDARRWFDDLLGQFSTSEEAVGASPQVMSTIREEYLRQLRRAETQAPRTTASPKHKSIRRRIFECSNEASSRLGLT
jgi:hypothetical protein